MAGPSRMIRARQSVSPHEDSESSSSIGSNPPPQPVMINPKRTTTMASTSNLQGHSRHDSHQRSSETSDTSSGLSAPSRPTFQNPNTMQPSRQPFQPRAQVFARHERWRDWQELSVILRNIPESWGTQQVHQILMGHSANPVRIDMTNDNGRRGSAKVIFRPPPTNANWIQHGLIDSATGIHIHSRYENEKPHQQEARKAGQIKEMTIQGMGMSFGIMKRQNTMLVMRHVAVPEHPAPRLVVNLHKQQLDLHFSLRISAEGDKSIERHLVFRIPFTQLREIQEDRTSEGKSIFVITPDAPPLAFRKTEDVSKTHDPKVKVWDERQIWYRQSSIDTNPRTAMSRKTQLRNDESIIDIGRWLSYRFECANLPQSLLEKLRTVLGKHNIPFRFQSIQCTLAQDVSYWSWLGNSSDSFNSKTVHLPFNVRYQLEACISQGYLHESSIDVAWVQELLKLDSQPLLNQGAIQVSRATKLLEKVLESKKRYHDPMDIFGLLGKVNTVTKKVPSYCTMVRSATVTPTTIYFNSPTMDTSNRVIRQFRQHEDRFLRVKFRDESYKGTIMSFDDDTCNELFTRVKRTMKNGIVVGDRHYEFLAYGNSQFRDHGAYFFAPMANLTTDMIRSWMGNFEEIKTIAKYASRVGQCFSTTRAIPNSVTVNRIPDIERNGYCFTDGVGKISMFSAQMTAQEMGLPSFGADCPSVFQFRLGGCKGVLAVDPSLKGQVIEVRPSQEKFPAVYKGLEICRLSQHATAYLNQQIVLVMSALGVRDEVFLQMLRKMLARLESAMSNESVALEMLQQNIDLNQSTLGLAGMILDGFMAAQDPFFASCMRLWRAWSIKNLKEKAKIFVEKGAFVLGCVDETGTLKGHSNLAPSSDTTRDVTRLPEIFLQVPNPKETGKFKVVEGICGIARNPSLHPGDLRMVNAVNVPQLKHLRACLVLPSTGDRDIASMCSGGDLDGDDYLVIWDPDLLPEEWNHAPMDYSAPPPVISQGPVTVDDMTSFFVTHMRNDNLPRIATAHRYWADKLEDGVKHNYCLELAALHSKAVDYAKTGVPAEMPKELKVTQWPHWAEKKHKRSYHSKKILGKLYDETERVPFEPAWDLPFDHRLLGKFDVVGNILASVREVKREYDEAVRRLMTQHGVKTEFEVWTTFIMEHNNETRDFKIAEELGETIASIKRQYQDLCYEKAGTSLHERDWAKLRPFIIGMYIVTAQEIAAANKQMEEKYVMGGQWVTKRAKTTETMPLMSFPWLFQRELGMIATGKDDAMSMAAVAPTVHRTGKKPAYTVSGAFADLPATLPSISTVDSGTSNDSLGMAPLAPLESIPAQDNDRKDSLISLGETATAQETFPLDILRTRSAVTEEASIMSGGSVMSNVLVESSAFEGGGDDSLGRELAKIEDLSDISGVCENQVKVEEVEGDERGGALEQTEVGGHSLGAASGQCDGQSVAEDESDDESDDDGDWGEQVTIQLEEASALQALDRLDELCG